MDKDIINHFSKKLLETPRRSMNEKCEIIEIYDQPERSKREDHNGIMTLECDMSRILDGCGTLNTMET